MRTVIFFLILAFAPASATAEKPGCLCEDGQKRLICCPVKEEKKGGEKKEDKKEDKKEEKK